MNLFIIFQYSNGVGHLTRCSALAAAFSTVAKVTLFSGGPPVAHASPPVGVDFVQLPATRWRREAGARPQPVDPALDAHGIDALRGQILMEHQARLRPAVVIVEYYPFAPGRFGATLDGFLQALKQQPARPLMVCSIRAYPRLALLDADVEPGWVNRQLQDHFDCVLHHADPALIPLQALGPYFSTALQGVPVDQTGFVRRPVWGDEPVSAPRGLLLTVGGGSPLGARMLCRWIDAARHGPAELLPLTVVCGPLMTAEDRARVGRERSDQVVVHDQVEALDPLILAARSVVCLGGYNTVVESLSLGRPVAAFANGPDSDQQFQVGELADRGMLLAGDVAMSREQMTALMADLLGFRARHAIDVDGARRSVQVVQQRLAARRCP